MENAQPVDDFELSLVHCSDGNGPPTLSLTRGDMLCSLYIAQAALSVPCMAAPASSVLHSYSLLYIWVHKVGTPLHRKFYKELTENFQVIKNAQ